MHTHSRVGLAISCLKMGLEPLIQDAATHGMDLFRGEEGNRGSRFARETAKELVNPKKKKKKKKKMNAGGKVGRGYGKARGAKACKYVSMKGA